MNEFIRIAFLWLSCECFLILQRSPFQFFVFKKFSLVKPTLCVFFVYFSKCCALVVILLNLSFLKKKLEVKLLDQKT